MLRIIAIFLVTLFCFGCSNFTKAKLGLKTYGPDQSTVSQREYLKIPPVLTDLPSPKVKE